jgi:DNA polymerase type B, organellar and viral
MAAWYNGSNYNILDISQFNYNSNTMLESFWLDFINSNPGRTCYFHNWAGYDSILSLPSLFNLSLLGYTFNPIVKDGGIISLNIKLGGKVQLPLLNKELLKVYDLSNNLDSLLRKGYYGGIVDVYRPYLKGEGYYYDINSLYPTAMCRPMPVGIPTLLNLTNEEFLNGEFFGFLEVTIEAPPSNTPGGYIGLLPVKHQGRLICPGGIFTGWYFSEELRFALANGYKLLSIKQAYSFQRGDNTFLALIQQLNQMKIEAQQNNQPTIRNIAKLLINSMYGRFGMHTATIRHAIVNTEGLMQIGKYFNILDEKFLGELTLVSYTLNNPNLILGDTKGQNTLKQFMKGSAGNTNVAIAAAVTAYSRIIINQYKLLALSLGLDIYYSDTDSLVLNGPLPPEHCDPSTLGKLKLENKITEGIFVMPKVYYLRTVEGAEVLKCKGHKLENRC